jgi:hypothetical protein
MKSQPLWRRERQEKALFWPLFHWSASAQTATDVAGTTIEGPALASVPLVGVCHSRQLRALVWPLFAWSSLDHPATVVAGTTHEGVVLTSVASVSVGTTINCGAGHDR